MTRAAVRGARTALCTAAREASLGVGIRGAHGPGGELVAKKSAIISAKRARRAPVCVLYFAFDLHARGASVGVSLGLLHARAYPPERNPSPGALVA